MNVVFHDSHHAGVSPVVHCSHGGETLLRDLRRVIAEGRTFGASEMALDLAIRWSLEYGRYYVGLHNLDTPGLAEGGSDSEALRARLAWVRAKVASDAEWVLVDTDEFRAFTKAGVLDLDEPSPAEPGAAPDGPPKPGPQVS